MKLFKNTDWLLIVILLIVLNIPLLSGTTPVTWDTFKTPYEEFSIAYNSVYFHNQLPFWLPFSNFGIPNFFLVSALSIVSFLFIGIGKIFQIQNVLLLFKVSLIGEQLISVLGMYLLANQLFRKRTTVLMVCFAFMANFAIYRQIQMNFRMIYLLPLTLYWIVLFFKRKSPEFLWLTGITMFLSVPGCAYYPVILVFYSLSIFAAILFFSDISVWKAIFTRTWKNLIAFICLLLIAVVFLYYFKTFSQGVGIMREGRSAGLSVSVGVFLSTLVSFNPLVLAGSLLYGIIPFEFTNFYEYVFYMGLLPVGGLIAAAIYQRKTTFFAVIAAGLFLYAISMCGYLSFALYYLPFIDLSHYIAAIGTVAFRTYLILAAGYGLDLDLSASQLTKIGWVFLGSIIAIDILGQISLASDSVSESGYAEVLMNPSMYTIDFKFFILRLAAYAFFALFIVVLNQWKKKPQFSGVSISAIVNIGLLIILVFDLGLFRYNFEKKNQIYLHRTMEHVPFLPPLQPYVYQETRLPAPIDERLQLADKATSAFQAFDGISVGGYLMESFIQFDRCLPDIVKGSQKFEIYSSSLEPLIANDLFFTSVENAPTGLKQIFGCEVPKLRVVTNVAVEKTDSEAVSAMKANPDLSNLLILSAERSEVQNSLNNPRPDADIKVVKFSANSISVEVDLRQSHGWLVYSDHYHPAWRATVNGEPGKIEQAYLAFKAVPLSQGTNIVEMEYGSPLMRTGYTVLAVLCGAAALGLFIWIIAAIFLPLGKLAVKPEDQ